MGNDLTSKAKALRRNATDAEKKLWRRLRSRQIEGVKFRRQHAVERHKDDVRDNCLSRNGFEVLRFWNNDVMQNMDGVLEVIRRACLK